MFRQLKLESEINFIKQLAESIGYGRMMNLTSALWRKKLHESGEAVEGALYPTPTFIIKDENKEMIWKDMTDFDQLLKDSTE